MQAIFDVDTTDVEPMYSVLEDRGIELREDIVEDCHPDLVLNNATLMEEGYIVAPPGNIPLQRDEKVNDFRDKQWNSDMA